MDIKQMKVSELTPYENNPRINDGAVEFVANSIKEFGFKVPIVIDKNNVITLMDYRGYHIPDYLYNISLILHILIFKQMVQMNI